MSIGPSDSLDLAALFESNGLGGMTVPEAIATGHLQIVQQGADLSVSFDADGFSGAAHSAVTLTTLENAFAVNVLLMTA